MNKTRNDHFVKSNNNWALKYDFFLILIDNTRQLK